MARKRNIFDPLSKEPFPLSRTKLSDFTKCARCYFLDRRLGISKPSLPAFSLNIATDVLLKKECDFYRDRKQPHPLMLKYGIDAIPFCHPDLSLWRNNFKGIRFHHHESHFILFGAVDDVWVTPDGQLIVVDYKATSTRAELTLDTPYREGYKRQLEIYQWLFRENGFDVSPRSFILYVNALTTREAFKNKLEFESLLIEHKGNCDWVADALVQARACLMGSIPEPSDDCEWCSYRAETATATATVAVAAAA